MKNTGVICILLLLCICMCSRTEPETAVDGEVVGGSGTITYCDFEGGFYGIICDDGVNLDPINLPIAFKKDGVRVVFKAKVRKELGSIHQWGTLVELIYVQKM